MTDEQHLQALRSALVKICLHETLKDYKKRNAAVLEALHHATEYGYSAGIRIDPSEMEWPVVFIELGKELQVTWHIEQHPTEWDGHNTEAKYRRVKEYLKKYV